MDKNYYLVNKETNAIHAYFRSDSKMTQMEETGTATLAGNFYLPESADLNLDKLQAVRYSSADYATIDWAEYYTEKGFGNVDANFIFVARANIVSYKGYRIFKFSDTIVQLWDDFANNQLFELVAFISTMFRNHIGEEEYAKWSETFHVVDKYGVNDIIMSHFRIESDNSEVIYNSEEITDVPGPDTPKEN